MTLIAGLAAALALSGAAAPNISDPLARQPQAAILGSRIGVAYGVGNSIRFVTSTDGGRTFGAPVTLPARGVLSLGNHRGPRIVMTPSIIVISAIYGDKGKGADGDLISFRSRDGGRTWSQGTRVNDTAASAREGLHAMAAEGNLVYAVWLDDRGGRKELYGAASPDGGASWGANQRIYQSPDGHICECCHPSVVVRSGGRDIDVMFRNFLGGSRDMFLASSRDGARTFKTAKLGEGTWPLNACPMDGGALTVDEEGPLTVWRRGSSVFLDRPDSKEIEIGPGKNPTLAGGAVIWTAPDGLKMRAGEGTVSLDSAGAYPAGASNGRRHVVAWETTGGIGVKAW